MHYFRMYDKKEIQINDNNIDKDTYFIIEINNKKKKAYRKKYRIKDRNYQNFFNRSKKGLILYQDYEYAKELSIFFTKDNNFGYTYEVVKISKEEIKTLQKKGFIF